MKNVLLAAAVASLLGVGLVAQAEQAAPPDQPGAQGQEPAQQPTAQRQPQQPAALSPAKMTISGCIESAPPVAAAGGAATSVPPAKFILANAKPVGGLNKTETVGTTGTAATRYQLDGEEKTISPHLNHQVEITGSVQTPAAAPGAGAASGTPAAPMLNVDSVKMLAAKCS